MAKYDSITVNFGEIWLKGRNRSAFIRKLLNNVRDSLRGEEYDGIVDERDRFSVLLNGKSDIAGITERLGKCFGISRISPVATVAADMEAIVRKAVEIVPKGAAVRVVPHRAFKGHAFTSDNLVSLFLKRAGKLPFELDRESDRELRINIMEEKASLALSGSRGEGGLPVGSSGKAVVLLSGGIDSPVAAYRAMRRGLEPVYLHVHAFPKNSEAKASKIGKLARELARYSGGRATVIYAPSHVFQAAALKAAKGYELILFKRFLFRLAERVAEERGAEVIATGESLGQVASQTVRNMKAAESGTRALVFRPLSGYDKQEIVNEAKRLGTFGISTEPYPDVCSLRARNPPTGASVEAIDSLYRECKLDGALERTLEGSMEDEIDIYGRKAGARRRAGRATSS